MPETSFMLTKIDFEFTDTAISAKLFGRNQHNEQVCLEDEKVYDYFLIDLTNKEESKIVEYFKTKSVKTEHFDAQIHDNNAHLLKVFTRSLKQTTDLVEEVKKEFSVDCYEHDLAYDKKYVMEKSLSYSSVYLATYVESSIGEFVNVQGKLDSLEQIPDKSISIKPKILFFDIETYDDGKGIDYNTNSILMISVVCEKRVYNLVAKKYDSNIKDVELFDNEVSLLQRFIDIIKEEQPDFISGYNIKGFDIPYIIARCNKFKVDCKIGTDNSKPIELKTKQRFSIHGVGILDLYLLLRHILRFAINDGSFSLDNVAKTLLGSQKDEVNLKELSHMWHDDTVDSEKLDLFVKYCEKDTVLCQELYNYFINDMEEFQGMLNIDFEDMSTFSFSQIVEGFLMFNAREFNQVIPNRPDEESVRIRQGKQIQGAFVYDPKPGFYENVSVYDFTSLYPTVIAGHNITKGTISQNGGDGYEAVPEREYFVRQKPKAFIPTIIEDIVTRRIRIKSMLKTADKNEELILKSRLQSLKIIANSLYGYLVFYMARWYSFEAGEAVTAFSRYHIKDVIRIFEEKGFKVIYSDTDSVFVLENKNIKESTESVAESINKTLPGLMSLEKENTFVKGIFVGIRGSDKGAKKKYALLDANGKYKIAGMAMVRGDWSVLARRIQEDVLHILLESEDVAKAKAYVKDELSNLERRDLSEFLISTKLKKPVKEYASKGPHVVVAERMIAKGQSVRVGKNISYIICKNSNKKASIGDRAKLVEEIKSVSEIDFDYYKKNQIYPVLEAIFDVFKVDIVAESEKKDQGLDSFF